MKNLIYLLVIFILLIACSTKNKTFQKEESTSKIVSDTIRIANDELEYEVIIIDAGFSGWINGRAKPRGFYGIDYLESRNQIFVREWNNRVLQPQLFNPNLYETQINFDNSTRYGYEVNYLIYNYFMYFQLTNNQQLSGFVPRQ